jgi:hypothetical protein
MCSGLVQAFYVQNEKCISVKIVVQNACISALTHHHLMVYGICLVHVKVQSFSSLCFSHIIPRQKILMIVQELNGWGHCMSMMERWREKFLLLPVIEIIAILRSPNSYPYFVWDCIILVLCDIRKLTLLPKMLFLCSTKVCVWCFMLSATSGLPYLHSYSDACGSPNLEICGSIIV